MEQKGRKGTTEKQERNGARKKMTIFIAYFHSHLSLYWVSNTLLHGNNVSRKQDKLFFHYFIINENERERKIGVGNGWRGGPAVYCIKNSGVQAQKKFFFQPYPLHIYYHPEVVAVFRVEIYLDISQNQ